MKVSYRNTKNINIFSWPEHAEIKILTPLYWIPSTVLKLSPHCTDVIPPLYWTTSTVLKVSPHSTEAIPPHVLLLSPHSTEGIPPQYWIASTVLMLSPRMYWCYPPTVLNHLHSTEAIPHSTEAIPPLYWTTSTVLKLSPTVLMLSPRCTEQPPMYWTTSTVLNRRYVGWFQEEIWKNWKDRKWLISQGSEDFNSTIMRNGTFSNWK